MSTGPTTGQSHPPAAPETNMTTTNNRPRLPFDEAEWKIEAVLADEGEGCRFYLEQYKPFRLEALQQDPDGRLASVSFHCICGNFRQRYRNLSANCQLVFSAEQHLLYLPKYLSKYLAHHRHYPST